MKKELQINVYDAANERIKYIFNNFKKVYVSFSGGKDSGVLLNLVIDYVRNNCPERKIGVMVMDNEANFTLSLEFMHRIIKNNLDILEVFWCCIPITLPCTVSSYETTYITWGEDDKHKWVRPMPKDDYIVNLKNNKFDFYEYAMHDKDFYDKFSLWYSGGDSCANLIGIRTHESLNRFRAIMNDKKEMHGDNFWTRKNLGNCFNCYPIFDWRTEDIWIANCKFDCQMKRLKRKFIPYWEWEDFQNGMWSKADKENESELLDLAIEHTSNHEKYGLSMLEVIDAWPKTMLHNLTNLHINRKAFVGHCAVTYKLKIPEYITRQAWKFLTDEQRYLANKQAENAIQKWENKYANSKNTKLHFVLGAELLF